MKYWYAFETKRTDNGKYPFFCCVFARNKSEVFKRCRYMKGIEKVREPYEIFQLNQEEVSELEEKIKGDKKVSLGRARRGWYFLRAI